MRVVVGGPVLDRAWILPAWFEHLRAACDRAGVDVDVEFMFVGDPHRDEATWAAIATGAFGPVHPVYEPDEPGRPDHAWEPKRYRRMIVLRNRGLREVRRLAPDAFLSLDSDILVHPDTVAQLAESLGRFAAVGAFLYMSTGIGAPSLMRHVKATGCFFRDRPQPGSVLPVDVIMAAKLMGPAAYNVDYEYHDQGEDCGWSLACRRAGLRLGLDARTVCKHIIERRQLGADDKRYDW